MEEVVGSIQTGICEMAVYPACRSLRCIASQYCNAAIAALVLALLGTHQVHSSPVALASFDFRNLMI